MAISKEVIVDQIEVVKNGSVQVRTLTKVIENGEQISSTFHRHVVAPGDDYSAEDARVQSICAATHTQDVIDAYVAAQPTIAQPE